jgi:hypothetical protein
MKNILPEWCILTRKIVVHFNPQNDTLTRHLADMFPVTSPLRYWILVGEYDCKNSERPEAI